MNFISKIKQMSNLKKLLLFGGIAVVALVLGFLEMESGCLAVSLFFLGGLFYEREETPDRVVIRFKYKALFYIVIVIAFLLSIFADKIFGRQLGFYVWGIVFILFLIFIVDLQKPSREINKAMKKHYVKFSGSRFSFSNPQTVIIEKRDQNMLNKEVKKYGGK